MSIFLFLDLSLDRLKSFVKEAPIGMPTHRLKTECRRPCGQPLGGTERLNAVASPTGVEDRLILRTCRTDASVYVLRTVRNALAGVTPERKRALA